MAQPLPQPSALPDNVRQLRLRRTPRWQWPLNAVLVGVAASLAIIAANHFRRGSVALAAFVWLAFFLRLLLGDTEAGWLTVRSKRTDLVVLLALAVGVSTLALIVPPPS